MFRNAAMLCALLLAGGLGCQFDRRELALPASQPAREPYIVHLPGIAGPRWIDSELIGGLKEGGLKAEISVFDWPGQSPGIAALQAYEHNRQLAARLAQRLAARYRVAPEAPIVLIGHSGGAGLAVWALEQLPPDVQVQTVLLLAPALSPEYDLTRALYRVRGHMYSFNNPMDALVLGAGTRMFGTIDGQRTDAAGRNGFAMPMAANPLQYQKLVQIPYDSQWRRYGNVGDHIGCMSRRFAAACLAPLLKGDPPATAPAAGPAAALDSAP